MIFKEYLPTFFEGFERRIVEFSNLEEMLDHEIFKKKERSPLHIRFSVYESGYPPPLNYAVMVEIMERGQHKYFVVGYVDEKVDLPQTDYEAIEAFNKKNEIPSN